MDSTRGPLSRNLYESLFKRVGSDQHVEIAGYLRDAVKTVFDETAAVAVRGLWEKAPWTVESNLDFVDWPSEPSWYEMPGYLRNVTAGDSPKMGFLVLPHPEGGGHYMVVTAFETSSIEPRHCFAVALIDAVALAENAVKARRFYSKTNDESVERIMSLIGVSISPDFRDELLITEDEREEVIEAVMRDATADIPLLLTLMAARAAENGLMTDLNEEGGRIVSLPKPQRTRLGKISDRLGRRLSNGLVRIPRAAKPPRLVWYA